ncbi:MAG: Scr1 family TA system antitoxin-like transcriptional regulator [Pseudonocardiaceae bacterium]
MLSASCWSPEAAERGRSDELLLAQRRAASPDGAALPAPPGRHRRELGVSDISVRANVADLRVLPHDVGGSPGLEGPFTLLTLPAPIPDIGHTEYPAGTLYIEDRDGATLGAALRHPDPAGPAVFAQLCQPRTPNLATLGQGLWSPTSQTFWSRVGGSTHFNRMMDPIP